eukprot:scaffold22907_cov38-Phaeocystis_antarctica.AAC.1
MARGEGAVVRAGDHEPALLQALRGQYATQVRDERNHIPTYRIRYPTEMASAALERPEKSAARAYGALTRLRLARSIFTKKTSNCGTPIQSRTRRPGRSCFSELETSKGGSDMIDCLRRAHRAALSLKLLGISHHGTDLESRSHELSEGTAGCRKPRRRVA